MEPLDTQTFSRLVGLIYDSAVDAARWTPRLDDLRATLNFEQAGVAILARATGELTFGVVTGIDEPWRSRMDAYWRYTGVEWGGEEQGWPETEPAILTQSARWAERPRTPYYLEWMQPQGLVDLMVIAVGLNSAVFGSVGLYRAATAGPIGAREVAAGAMLMPHLQRAAAIGSLLEMRSLVAADFRSVLEGLRLPVLLVDARMQVVFANPAAEVMLRLGDPIILQSGVVATHSHVTTAALARAAQDVGADETTQGRRGFGIPVRQSDGTAALLHVLPLRHGELRPSLVPRATAAIFIAPAVEQSVPGEHALAALFDLTGTEARVFALVAKGKTPAEAAVALGVAVSTVRTHLLRVFEKTGAGRQADIARLAASLSMPL